MITNFPYSHYYRIGNPSNVYNMLSQAKSRPPLSPPRFFLPPASRNIFAGVHRMNVENSIPLGVFLRKSDISVLNDKILNPK